MWQVRGVPIASAPSPTELQPFPIHYALRTRPIVTGHTTRHAKPLFVSVSVPQFLALCIEAEARPGDGAAPVALTHSRHGWPGPMMSLTQLMWRWRNLLRCVSCPHMRS